jgi:hypothetical protein
MWNMDCASTTVAMDAAATMIRIITGSGDVVIHDDNNNNSVISTHTGDARLLFHPRPLAESTDFAHGLDVPCHCTDFMRCPLCRVVWR